MIFTRTSSRFALVTRYRTHIGPVAVVLCATVGLLWHIILTPFSIGVANTDTEGTIWWIWSQCTNGVHNDVATRIASPVGFDLRGFAGFNLVDAGRTALARAVDCRPRDIVFIVSLFPVVSFFANLLAAYAVGWSLFRNRLIALSISLTGVVSSQLLLATRTPLANNLLAPGLLALLFLIRHFQTYRLRHFALSCLFLYVQALSNAYNGAMFLIAMATLCIIMARASVRALVGSVSRLLGIFGSFAAGVFPLLDTQLFLMRDTGLREAYRPVNPAAEVVNPLVLLSRTYSWLDGVQPSFFPTPEAGWISLPLLLVWCASLPLLLKRSESYFFRKLSLSCSLSSCILTCLAFDVPGTDFMRNFYFAYFSSLRGVSNYSKLTPLLLSIACAAAVHDSARRAQLSITAKRVLVCLLAMGVGLNIADGVPTSPSFRQRTSLEEVETFYSNELFSMKVGVVAHFPDYTYEKNWGFPTRFIQLAQLYSRAALANGRTYEQTRDSCMRLPPPLSTAAYWHLQSRGVARVVLHRRLMPDDEYTSAVRFLNREHIYGTQISSFVANAQPDIYGALDVQIFDLPIIQDRPVCGSTFR